MDTIFQPGGCFTLVFNLEAIFDTSFYLEAVLNTIFYLVAVLELFSYLNAVWEVNFHTWNLKGMEKRPMMTSARARLADK